VGIGKPRSSIKAFAGGRVPACSREMLNSMWFRGLMPRFYFFYDATYVSYAFSKYWRTWNYTVLKKPDSSESRWVSAYTIFMQCPKQKAASRK